MTETQNTGSETALPSRAKNPTWIVTTAGGPQTQVAESFSVVCERLRQAHFNDDPVVALTVATVNAAGEKRHFRRMFMTAHIVQVGDTESRLTQ